MGELIHNLPRISSLSRNTQVPNSRERLPLHKPTLCLTASSNQQGVGAHK